MIAEPNAADPGVPDLNTILLAAGLAPLTAADVARFDAYLTLILRWNARMNLTAVRDTEGVVRRHFVESIATARSLPEGIRTLLDFGSGAGFPGIPIALCRPEMEITLAESQSKKAAFLQESVRVLGLTCSVWPKRAEKLEQQFDCVVLRAVDSMEKAVTSAAVLLAPGGWLGILTTRDEQAKLQRSLGNRFEWSEPVGLPDSEQRVSQLGKRVK